MGSSCQSAARTMADVIARRPVLEAVLRTFEPLLEARDGLVSRLAEEIRTTGFHLPAFQRERAVSGVPLMADMPVTGLAPAMRHAAEIMLPLLFAQQVVAPHAAALEEFFLRSVEEGKADARENLAEAMLNGSTEAFAGIADRSGIPPEVLAFAADFVVSPVLRALVWQGVSEEEDFPWEEEGVWREGYCPVCGTFPSIAWLDRPSLDEKNAYLSGGGGKKHLHCSLCGSNWKFRRGVCPSCGKEGDGVMEILRESSGARGERLDWCTQCKSYCPTVDLREREGIPHMDAMAMGMMHLDMVASHRKLRPLKPSFWNMF